MNTIAVAVDGSDFSNAAVGVACDIAVRRGAELVACHAVTDEPLRGDAFRFALAEFGAEIVERLRDLALGRGRVPGDIDEDSLRGDRDATVAMNMVVGEGVLEAAEAMAQRAGVARVSRRLLVGSPGAELVNYVRAEAPDVLVVGTRGLGGVEGLILGSVSRDVAQAPCMVVTVKIPPRRT